MNAASRVLRAWCEPGPERLVHLAAQTELRRSWPALAGALDELARETRESAVRALPADAVAMCAHGHSIVVPERLS